MVPGYSRRRGYRFSLFLSAFSITLLSPRDLFIFYLFVGQPILQTLFAMAFYRRTIAFSFVPKHGHNSFHLFHTSTVFNFRAIIYKSNNFRFI